MRVLPRDERLRICGLAIEEMYSQAALDPSGEVVHAYARWVPFAESDVPDLGPLNRFMEQAGVDAGAYVMHPYYVVVAAPDDPSQVIARFPPQLVVSGPRKVGEFSLKLVLRSPYVTAAQIANGTY